MKHLKEAVATYAVELAMTVGAALVSLGIGMYSRPAGVIAVGVFILAGAVLSCMGGGQS